MTDINSLISNDKTATDTQEVNMNPLDHDENSTVNNDSKSRSTKSDDRYMKNPKAGSPSDTGVEAETTSSKETTPDLSAVDPFDPSRFRRKTLAATVGTQEKLTKCPLLKKPNSDQWVRASTDPELSGFPCTVLELPTEGEVYLLLPSVADSVVSRLPTLVKDLTLTLGIDRLENTFLWRTVPAQAPNGDNSWNVSGRLALAAAQKQWVRVESNSSAHCYEYETIQIDLPDPEWPALTMGECLRLAFAERIIEDASHPVIQRLLGKAA